MLEASRVESIKTTETVIKERVAAARAKMLSIKMLSKDLIKAWSEFGALLLDIKNFTIAMDKLNIKYELYNTMEFSSWTPDRWKWRVFSPENCDLSAQTANNYIRFYEEYTKDPQSEEVRFILDERIISFSHALLIIAGKLTPADYLKEEEAKNKAATKAVGIEDEDEGDKEAGNGGSPEEASEPAPAPFHVSSDQVVSEEGAEGTDEDDEWPEETDEDGVNPPWSDFPKDEQPADGGAAFYENLKDIVQAADPPKEPKEKAPKEPKQPKAEEEEGLVGRQQGALYEGLIDFGFLRVLGIENLNEIEADACKVLDDAKAFYQSYSKEGVILGVVQLTLIINKLVKKFG